MNDTGYGTCEDSRSHDCDNVRRAAVHDHAMNEPENERRSRRRIEEAFNVGTCSEGRIELLAGGRLAGRDLGSGAVRGDAPRWERGRGV